jgi:hypothetical protein
MTTAFSGRRGSRRRWSTRGSGCERHLPGRRG